MTTEERIRALLEREDPTTCEWAREPAFYATFLQHCVEAVDSDPESGLSCVRTALEIAPGPCDTVQALGLHAMADRARGRYPAALDRLSEAFAIGGDCPDCLADLFRRRAFVWRDLGRFTRALAEAEQAIERYRASGHAGHDLYSNGLASAYMCRGQIRYEAGSRREGIADMALCLSLVDPDVSPKLHWVSVYNLAGALAGTGNRSDLRLAEGHLKTARWLLKKRAVGRPSQEHAKLAWLTGMVRHELATAKPHRVRETLVGARRDLLHLGFVQEAAAITADLTRIAFPDRRRIREALDGLNEDLEALRRSLPEATEAALDQVERAFAARGWTAHETLKAAVEELRETCGPRMLACLVSWRPLR